MNRKYIVALFALTCVLSGCSHTKENALTNEPPQSTNMSTTSDTVSKSSAVNTSSTVSTSTSTAATSSACTYSTVSSSSEASSSSTTTTTVSTTTATATSTTTTSSTSIATTTTSSSSSQNTPQPVERDVVGSEFVRTVHGGGTYYVESGVLWEIDGSLVIENGTTLNISDGAELLVNGDVEVNGELLLSPGGKLTMGKDSARITGEGSVIVKKDFDQIDCEHGIIYAHITPPERVVSNGVTTVGGVVIANKSIKLPPEFGSHLSDGQVEAVAYNALAEMNKNSSHRYYIVSAYRSYYTQKAVFQKWVNIYGFDEASRISSQAGHSEHQTGLTMDLDSLEVSYANTAEGKWLAENCWKYGFIIRYPDGKESITGYSYEPWHVRYLGKSTASLVYHSGLTLEEFLNVEGGTVVID